MEWEGSNIVELRKALNLTQAQFAKELGVSERVIRYWEREERRPNHTFQKRLNQLQVKASKENNRQKIVVVPVETVGTKNVPLITGTEEEQNGIVPLPSGTKAEQKRNKQEQQEQEPKAELEKSVLSPTKGEQKPELEQEQQEQNQVAVPRSRQAQGEEQELQERGIGTDKEPVSPQERKPSKEEPEVRKEEHEQGKPQKEEPSGSQESVNQGVSAPPAGSEETSHQEQGFLVRKLFIGGISLSDTHRKELKEHRGFSDDLIDELSFRSGEPQSIVPVISSIVGQGYRDCLISEGLLLEDGSVNKQILDGYILIPYLDEHGEIYRIRAHKLGFKGKSIDVYCRYFLKESPKSLSMTESEFKAAALRQLGFPSIGIPGVSSFAGEHFPSLVELLREFGVKHVTILFDNEDKSNPLYPGYKEDFRVRYDTDFYAFLMAYKLEKEGFVSDIARFPDEWRINGKVDCDSALAAGHKKEEFQYLLDSAVNCYKYLDALPQEAQSLIRRKIDRYFFKSPLEIGKVGGEKNSYAWVILEKNEKTGKVKEYREIISNFYLKIDYTLYTSRDCLRRCVFVNRYGERSDSFFLEPTVMAGAQEFTTFALGRGNYLWQGTTAQLKEVWRHAFVHDDGAAVYQPDGYGLNEHGLWQFGNIAISQKGEVIKPSEETIFWMEENRLGFVRPMDSAPIERKKQKDEDFVGIPILSSTPLDIRKTINLLRASTSVNSGGFGSWLAIGWMAASLFCDKIVEAFHVFPLLFIGGKTGSGKSTFGRWLMALTGSPQKEGKAVSATTDKGLFRMLAKNSNLPVWLGDFRNTAPESRIETFRNVYDRISYVRAAFTSDLQTSTAPCRGTLMLDGEETPKDPALLSRCVIVLLSEHQRGDRAIYDEIEKMTPYFSNFTYQILQRQQEFASLILERIPIIKEDIARGVSDDRLALNYGIVSAALSVVIEKLVGDIGADAFMFAEWLTKDALRNRELKISEDVLSRFFETLNVLANKVIRVEDGIEHTVIEKERHYVVEGDKLYLWFSGAFAEYEADERRRGHSVFLRSAILDYLKEEPYVMEASFPKKIGGRTQRCIVLNLTKAPEVVRSFAMYEVTVTPQNKV